MVGKLLSSSESVSVLVWLYIASSDMIVDSLFLCPTEIVTNAFQRRWNYHNCALYFASNTTTVKYSLHCVSLEGLALLAVGARMVP